MWKDTETDLTSTKLKEKNLSGCEVYEDERQRVKRRRLQCDEINRDSATIFDCSKEFTIENWLWSFHAQYLHIQIFT
ncbi:hypothetical protein PR048_023187 [Dryococelus australis]|uniref:Uncharacterized protein n=1 Tax=Dryococelus australis TaxID=614101 RepID=A0ABQ9GTE7_9NEOP|nr:hypothetical protein PR048_023187 [Dryococelus australis]